MSIPVITISREYGSGGRAIGERLAKELGIPFYDKELIFMAAKESGLSEEYIKKTEQMKSTSFLYGLYMGAQQLPMNDQIFLVQSKIIRQVASEGPCVIVGRCADVILKDYHPLNLFVYADKETKIERCLRRAPADEKLTRGDIERRMRQIDRGRAQYREMYADSKRGAKETYHLCISTTEKYIKEIIPGLAAYVRCWFGE